jgi:histidinol-phosphate aminotransferase
MNGFSATELVRPHLRTLKPYSSARDEYSGKEGVFLDANENPYGSTTDTGAYNRYPDPYQAAIKQPLAAIKGVAPEQIFLGNGSDEPIDLLMRIFCRPGLDRILTMPPTYGMYEVSANINQVELVTVPLTPDYQINTEAVLAALDDTIKIVWICSPNNPSGNLLHETSIRQIVEQFQGLVVVDEAYIDFADTPSWTTQLSRYPNLVVLQTFSKAWGLAGLRMGACYASPEIIGWLNKIKPPYNIGTPTQALMLSALAHESRKNSYVKEILAQREALVSELSLLSIVQKIHPSDANFVLVQFQDAASVMRYLLDRQVIVRDRSKVTLCDGCLRITVGTAPENRLLLDTLAHYPS